MTKLAEIIYRGERSLADRGSYIVVKNFYEDPSGYEDFLNPRHDLRDHSLGFGWGYEGSGPAQLALALLSDALPWDIELPEGFGGKGIRNISDHDIVVEFFYERFKHEAVAKFKPQWETNRSEILNWLDVCLRKEFAVSLKMISKTCARSVSLKDRKDRISVSLASLPNGQIHCNVCHRTWERDEGLRRGDWCPSCSDLDIYVLRDAIEAECLEEQNK